MNDTVSAGNTKKQESLYVRLGGYDAISAVVGDLVQRLAADPKLGRFWAHRGADGIRREKQLVVDFIVDRAGGPLFYSGRDMVTSHKGMRISDEDWKLFMTYLRATLEKFKVAEQEKSDVTGFMESLKATMVE
ncbi:MAG: group 1 truncated hemoglobin [Betaproteobacteria bacterium HGW-Betaproteobacteria-5]|nr:MAG: group 1 truncated hemoglobin [Betaproteobacteria bacterium HGW-Betaproteobacteria-5]